MSLQFVIDLTLSYAEDPPLRLFDLLAELESEAKDQMIVQLLRLVNFALMKPPRFSDAEWLERVALLAVDPATPQPGDPWAGVEQ